MRTTLTLDPDVAAKLKAQARRTGRPFKSVVNDAIRRGLLAADRPAKTRRFVVRPRDLGAAKPGVQLDNIGELLEHIEGPHHR
ncbi:MAG TPA: hypothetical protein VFV78_12650 [Vicinamibacterales bacterium]|nr:hypothetical protein [Vicinamibacterales bacterium]